MHPDGGYIIYSEWTIMSGIFTSTMKLSVCVGILVAFTLCVLLLTHAEEEKNEPQDSARVEYFHEADLNKNGILSRPEVWFIYDDYTFRLKLTSVSKFLQLSRRLRQQEKDYTLKKMSRKEHEDTLDALFNAHDKNQDGRITLQEWDGARDELWFNLFLINYIMCCLWVLFFFTPNYMYQ